MIKAHVPAYVRSSGPIDRNGTDHIEHDAGAADRRTDGHRLTSRTVMIKGRPAPYRFLSAEPQ